MKIYQLATFIAIIGFAHAGLFISEEVQKQRDMYNHLHYGDPLPYSRWNGMFGPYGVGTHAWADTSGLSNPTAAGMWQARDAYPHIEITGVPPIEGRYDYGLPANRGWAPLLY